MKVINNLNNYVFPERDEVETQVSVNDDIRYNPFPSRSGINNNNIPGLIVSTSQELLNREVDPEFFIINPLIPKEAITNISADSGKGKSLFALILAYHIASGATLFEKYSVEKGKVLIIDQEQNFTTVLSRYKKIISTSTPVDYVVDQRVTITDDEDYKKIRATIISGGYSVVIFDTFIEIIGSGNENDSSQMKFSNSKMLDLIRETKVTIVYLHHHRKLQKGERLTQSVSRGSTEIIAKVSSHLLLDSRNYKDELGNKVLEMTVSQEKARSSARLDGKISLKIINDDFENKIRWEYLGEAEEKGKKVEEAKIFIIEILSSRQGATVKDLEETSDVGISNIRIALKELTLENKIDVGQQGKAKYYFINR